MQSSVIVAVCAILMLVFLFMKVPVYLAVLAASAIYFVLNPYANPTVFAQQSITGVESISLLAIPFFVCAGIVMNYTGVTSRIMNFCSMLTGRMTGGLAQVNVLLSTLMGGLSGSNLADAAMEAKMMVPEMEKAGFSKSFSTVVTAVSSMITPLIPPGIAMILYGCIANVSIGKLFISGIGVGAILCIAEMVLVAVISRKRGYQPMRTEKLTMKEVGKATKPAILPLCLPIIIIGGIRLGAFTATEAGAVAIIYAVILGIVYRELKWKDVLATLKETVTSTASIMLIVSAAAVFSWILTKEQIPQQLTEWMMATIQNKYVFLLVVNVFLIILVPLLAPVAASYGIDEIQFAMVYIFNNALGAFSPPLGTLMFVTCGITKCKTKDFIKESAPFYILLFAVLLLTYVPFCTTALVNLFY